MKTGIIIAAVIILVLFAVIFGIWIFFTETELEELRDLIIVFVGLFLVIFSALMAGVAVALFALVSLLRSKLPPLLDQANATAENVRGTSGYISERVVSPFIKVSAAAAGARAAAQALVRRSDGR